MRAIITATALSVLVCGPAAADEPPPGLRLQAMTGVAADDRSSRSLQVVIDFARILTLSEAARTVVIGNPGIIDATISDERTLVLTGKAAGTTNLIVMGEGTKEVLNAIVDVVPNNQVTTVYHGAQRHTYSCVSACTPVLSVGDDNAQFDAVRAQIQGRQNFTTGSTPEQ